MARESRCSHTPRLLCAFYVSFHSLGVKHQLLQVFVDGELLGGSEETLDLLKDGKLQERISNAKGDALPQVLQELVRKSTSGLEVGFHILTPPFPTSASALQSLFNDQSCPTACMLSFSHHVLPK